MPGHTERVLKDLISSVLTRGGLSPRLHCSNELSVYKITEVNEFDGIYEPLVELRGYVHFQEDITIRHTGVHDPRLIVDLADPEFHIKILLFFKVEQYEIDVMNDHDAFDNLT